MVIAAVGQICSRNNVATNLRVCQSLIRRAAHAGAKLVCLPEASDYITTADQVYALAEPLDTSTFVRGLREEAKASNVWISVGVHERRPTRPSSTRDADAVNGIDHTASDDDKRCFNTQCLITSDGEIASAYRKIHLFDVDIKGGLSIKESGTTIPGDEASDVLDTPVGRVGMLTCYDLRFPEVSLSLRQRGADIITYPSAFLVRTGMAHWEPLLRARAIETQSYVFAAAQVGSHPPTTRSSYGKACIVDPWGSVLATCNDDTAAYENTEDGDDSGGFCIADIDLSYLSRIRREMPLWEQRRPELYS